ncbi:MAG: hypothetical protein U9Q83_05090, partial [Bacteroidota bacterium]|nr:hypothetical protein [Bacteroidota bacterium]
TKDKLMIAPEYTILLAKTADNYLATASSKTNHFGLPIGSGAKTRHRMPYNNNAVKTISETESRLYISYVSRYGLAELKDRGASLNTHKHIYTGVLNADKPTNVESIVDRSIVPYGGESSLELINNIFNSAGVAIDYVKDTKKIHKRK